MLAVLIVASVSGTVFELGACFYLFAAAAAGLAVSAGQRTRAAPARSPAKKLQSVRRPQPAPAMRRGPGAIVPVDAPRPPRRVPAWPNRQ
jgi:hypothetical protein